MDIPVQELRPFVRAHAHQRGVQLRPAWVTLYIKCTAIRTRLANKHCLTFTYSWFLQYLLSDTSCDFNELFLMDSMKFSCFIRCKV